MLGVSQTVPTMQGMQGKGAGEQQSRSRQKGCEHGSNPAQRSAEYLPVQSVCATATHRPGPLLILGRASMPMWLLVGSMGRVEALSSQGHPNLSFYPLPCISLSFVLPQTCVGLEAEGEKALS